MRGRSIWFLLLACALAAVVASCAEEQYPKELWDQRHAIDAGSAAADPGAQICAQAHAESLPARLVAMSATGSGSADVVLVSDLFQRFRSVCGGCHGPSVDPPGQGGFQIRTSSDFTSRMTASILAHVTSDACPVDPSPSRADDPMPPCSSPNGGQYSKRSETDPVRQFGELVQAWLAAGSPASFAPPGAAAPDAGGADGGTSAYAMTPDRGNAMTNLGDCIPTAALVATESTKSAALDAMFAGLSAAPSGTAAQMIGLPERLRDTDLFTFDGETLARHGVVAFVPAYPLWSDDAGKLRYVRVPRGESIHFDKATQSFSIPANTRFYKTFMKPVVDTDGSIRWRKVETRLIVARPDAIHPDGSVTPTALFGTYKWNEDESDAVLVETPLNSGRPFADTLLLYRTDEQLAAAILGGKPGIPEEALLEGHAARHYAIPSSERCTQCHMGSASRSFVLGFLPVQIKRRAAGTGGTIEPTAPDEATQLQRLVDYGVVTGIDSIDDVLPLEAIEGDRAPRNDDELTAQGYMLGNCSHCHNPHGYPTIQNPVLKDVLNFLPGPDGGIFQFPLERFSPRIGRGPSGSTPIPYVTPSLMDLPRATDGNLAHAPDPFIDGDETGIRSAAYAPWRSILYRNVDSAFAYTDDLALFPHMPMNTPGYDPRAKRILADWMVSIPAVRKHPELPEYAVYTNTGALGGTPDSEPQPFVEVKPGAPGYDDAAAAAKKRLAVLHTGVNADLGSSDAGVAYSRYADDFDTSDIEDPQVLLDPIGHPVPTGKDVLPRFVPRHPHWVITDLTVPPPPWAPRNSNWSSILVLGSVPPATGGDDGQKEAYADQLAAIRHVQSATLSQVASFAQTKVPFGLWVKKPQCDFSSVPTVQSFTGDARPHWMDVTSPAADAPVYSQSPGAAVFKMICINCHGPNADSNGRMAQNLATMTGGLAQVADFRDGLFATEGDARNIDRVFGVLPAGAPTAWQTGIAPDDRAARYMAWMALGGTAANIPLPILQIIANTHVLDRVRALSASSLSANMLSQAKAQCRSLFGPVIETTFNVGEGHGYVDFNLNDGLIKENGDAEMWLRLCSVANLPPVRVLHPKKDGDNYPNRIDVPPIWVDNQFFIRPGSYVSWADYQATGAAVGNEHGGVDADMEPPSATLKGNLWPWCVDPTGASDGQVQWIAQNALPLCPKVIVDKAEACLHGTRTDCYGADDANDWAVRGAVNAGFSVFLYLRDFIEGKGAPPPDYDQCERLTTP
jgi:mono/diheme cytochrome c family protein